MPLQLERTHTIYISSKHRTGGTPSRFSVIIPQPVIDVDYKVERIKISLLDFNCYFSWYSVNEGFNTIYFTNLETNKTTTVSLHKGTYKYQQLQRAIRAAYPECGIFWNEMDNKFEFSFAVPHRMEFDGIYETLGFTLGAKPEGTLIEPTNSMLPMPFTYIYVNLANVSPCNDSLNLDNFIGDVRVSNVLARVPVNCAPFRNIFYQNVAPDDTGIDTTESSLNRLDFVLTNADGVELTFLPDYEMTLRFQVYSQEDENTDMKQDIRTIRENVGDIFLHKMLKRQNL